MRTKSMSTCFLAFSAGLGVAQENQVGTVVGLKTLSDLSTEPTWDSEKSMLALGEQERQEEIARYNEEQKQLRATEEAKPNHLSLQKAYWNRREKQLKQHNEEQKQLRATEEAKPGHLKLSDAYRENEARKTQRRGGKRQVQNRQDLPGPGFQALQKKLKQVKSKIDSGMII
jgi:hypothetical protein